MPKLAPIVVSCCLACSGEHGAAPLKRSRPAGSSEGSKGCPVRSTDPSLGTEAALQAFELPDGVPGAAGTAASPMRFAAEMPRSPPSLNRQDSAAESLPVSGPCASDVPLFFSELTGSAATLGRSRPARWRPVASAGVGACLAGLMEAADPHAPMRARSLRMTAAN